MKPAIPARQTYGVAKLLGLAGLVMFVMHWQFGHQILIIGLLAMAANIALFPADILKIENPPLSTRYAGGAMGLLFLGILVDLMGWPDYSITLGLGLVATMGVIAAGKIKSRQSQKPTNWTSIMLRETFAWVIIGGYLFYI